MYDSTNVSAEVMTQAWQQREQLYAASLLSTHPINAAFTSARWRTLVSAR
jgi:hypothetical protein